jgi:catechol 2,3-dioxygenase-like lactoylglutathione lyase family enzyme
MMNEWKATTQNTFYNTRALPSFSHKCRLSALLFCAVEVLSSVSTIALPSHALGTCLRGMQHVGLTVNDLNTSVEFYTEVLGGQLVASGEGFYGEFLHNTLFQKEDLDKTSGGADVGRAPLPDLRDGSKQVLDLRLISFGDTAVELLHFRNALARSSTQSSSGRVPSAVGYANAMHLCFHLKDEVDMNEFARALEDECRKRHIGLVCNRLIHVSSEDERRKVAPKYYVNRFWKDPKYFIEGYSDRDFGDFQGCAFFYCKGPDGEQLEFCQVTRRLKELSVTAEDEYRKKNPSSGACAGEPVTIPFAGTVRREEQCG